MHTIAGLQVELCEVERELPGPVGQPHAAQLLHSGGLGCAAGRHAPDANGNRLECVIVGGEQLDLNFVFRLDQRINSGRKNFRDRRRVGHHFDGKRRRHIRDLRGESSSTPLPARRLRWLQAAAEPAAVRFEPKRVATARECDRCERFGRVPFDRDRRAGWQSQRGVAGQGFRSALEIRGVRRQHRHIAHERTVNDAYDRRVARGAPVAHDERQVGVERPQFRRDDTGIEGERRRNPCVARTPAHQRDR